MATAALGALGGRFPRDDDFGTVFTVPRGNAMSPPQLPRDAPVVNVAHPLEIGLGVILRHELDVAVLDYLDGAVGQRLNLDEPLRRKPWFDDGLAAVTLSQRDNIVLRTDQKAASLEIFQHLLSRLEAVQ